MAFVSRGEVFMANVTTREVPLSGPEVVETTAHPRVSWGAIFAGAVVALSMWAMLLAGGLAVGLTSLDPGDPSTLRSSGIFTGLWGMIAPLVALFVGGLVAARSAGVIKRLDAGIHGLVMWGLATVAGTWLVGSFMATLIGGAASFGRTAFEQELREGRTTTSQTTPMARAQAAAEELRREMTGQPSAAPMDQRRALEAAESSGKAFGGMFGALFLGMVSAVAGALVGLHQRHYRGRPATRHTVTTTRERPVVTERPVTTTEREAYP
jgi:hypothetical protein